jgi:hypothetical protein
MSREAGSIGEVDESAITAWPSTGTQNFGARNGDI